MHVLPFTVVCSCSWTGAPAVVLALTVVVFRGVDWVVLGVVSTGICIASVDGWTNFGVVCTCAGSENTSGVVKFSV